MRVAFVEWPEGLRPDGPEWMHIGREVVDARPDLLITDELPFGDWIAAAPAFDRDTAQRSIDVHAAGLTALAALGVPAVLTSRPVWSGVRLANEAVLLAGGEARPVHRKQYFPSEPGWSETAWYEPGSDDFPLVCAAGLNVGVLLCTEAMFNEHARRYGRRGAALIALPRATGASRIWRTAGEMAAIVSGAYVISSNRSGETSTGPQFGGGGFAFAPDGKLMATTTSAQPLVVVDIDANISFAQQSAYPCYVARPPSGNTTIAQEGAAELNGSARAFNRSSG